MVAGQDLDGDGYGDMCIGSVDTDYGQGHVRLYRGGPALDATCDAVWIGENTNHEFGYALAVEAGTNRLAPADPLETG